LDAFARAPAVVIRLCVQDDGQDLVEYALLTGIVAVAAAVALPVAGALGDIYNDWLDNVNELWEPPAPTGGGGGG
jgi:Flp pilus assembly pilin Flp